MILAMKTRAARQVLLAGSILHLSFALQAQVVINEVDMDQVGTDNAEFLEIKNVGTSPFPLQYLQVVLINGNAGGAVEYLTIQNPAWPPLAPNDYFVICANEGLTLNCDHVAIPATKLIQNGSPDAIALRSNVDGTVWDMLSYGGAVPGYTEGSGTTAEDSNVDDGVSLSRWPDGMDTDNNDADFVIGCATPGLPNRLDPVNCVVTTSIDGIDEQPSLILLPMADAGRIGLLIRSGGPEPIEVAVFTTTGSLVASRHFGPTAMANWSISVAEGQLYVIQARRGHQHMVRRVLVP